MIVRELLTVFGIDFDEQSAKQAENGIQGLAEKAKLLGAAFAGGALVKGLQSLVTESAAIADQVGKTSSKLGVEVEALQELRFAAEQSGVAANVFDTSLQRLTRRAAEAAMGTGVAKDSLKQLGVSLHDSSGKMRTPQALLGAIADGMQGVVDPAEKLRLAVSLFDTEGAAMVNMLASGSAGIQNLRKEARSLGSVVNSDTTAAAANFGDALNRMNHLMTGLKYAIMREVLPYFQRLTNFSVGLWKGFLDVSKNTSIIRTSLIALGLTAGAVGAILVASFLPAIVTFAGITAGATGIALIVDDLISLFSGGESIIKDFWNYLKSGSLQAWTGIKEAFSDFRDWLLSSIDSMVSRGQALLSSMVPDFLKSGLNSTIKFFAQNQLSPGVPSISRNISSSNSQSNIHAPINQNIQVEVKTGATSNPQAMGMEVSRAVRRELDKEKHMLFHNLVPGL